MPPNTRCRVRSWRRLAAKSPFGWTRRRTSPCTPDDNLLLAGLSDHPAQRQPMTIEYFEYLNRFAAFEATLWADGQWFFPHRWLMTFIGDSQVEFVVNAELDALSPAADLGQVGQVALSPIRRPAISSPLLRMPSDDLCYAFNLVRMLATGDANEAGRLVDANRAGQGCGRHHVPGQRAPAVEERVARPFRPGLRSPGRREAAV
jgi:hypothetical protein